ncbi:thiamine pyrophosphate-binding protein [Myxococcota bacterium]|nr:thiamine pyrophosphate-binding protein [Myxococcota bacterium]
MLAARGVDVVFGLPGGTIAPVFDALIDHPEIRVVTVKHEAGAMFAAAGYARTTGKLGVVLVTSGPGVLNAMTGLAAAHCDGIPILVLAGEVSRETFGRGALQEGSAYFLNVVQMTRHISKLALEIPEPSAAPATLRRAIATAMSGRRGPVVVTLPLDVTRSTIQVPEISQGVSTRFELDEGAVVLAANALAKSRSKVIFAGSGVRAGRGPELLRAVAERLDCPVMTTPKAKGVFPEDHRLALGVFGMGGHPSTQAYLEAGVEAVLAIGTSLGDLATNGWSPLLDASRVFVHVDIDASQIGRAYPANVAIAAPAEVFFDQLLARVPAAETTQAHGVRRHAPTATATPGKIAPHTAIAELQAVLPRDAIYTVDSGEHYFFATHFLEITHPDSFFVMTGLGAMGSSIGAAIGAQLAQPDRRVVVLCGDGGFAMAAGDVATAAAHELPITFVVFDDRRLGMVELGNLAIFGRTPSYPAGPVDVAGLGRALGADSAVIDGPGQLLTHPALRSPGRRPLVLDVLVDESVRMPKHGRFEALGAKR